MKYWRTADRLAQGQSVRKLSNLFQLKHPLTEQNNGIIKTFSLSKDLLWRKTSGTEVWEINYKNMVLSRMKKQKILQVRQCQRQEHELGWLSVWPSAFSWKKKVEFCRKKSLQKNVASRKSALGNQFPHVCALLLIAFSTTQSCCLLQQGVLY